MTKLLDRTLRRLRALGLPLALLAAAPAARAQVSLDDRIASLGEHVKKKSDDNACAVIDGIEKTFTTFTDDEKKKAIGAVEKCLNARRDDGDDKLFEKVVESFANMGEYGEKATIKCLKTASVEKRRSVLASALRSLGFHKSPANIKTITDYLVNSEPIVVAGAADSLSNYAEQPEKVRKPIVEELVKNYCVFASAATQAGAAQKDKLQAKDKLATVEKPFQSALQKLCGQEFKDAPAAQKWFNDNKGKKWPDLPPPAGGSGSRP